MDSASTCKTEDIYNIMQMGNPAPPQTIHTTSICSNSHVTITIPVPVLIPYSPCTLSYPLFPLYCYHIPLSNGSRVFTRPRHLHMHALFRAATACGRRPAGPAARTEQGAGRSTLCHALGRRHIARLAYRLAVWLYRCVVAVWCCVVLLSRGPAARLPQHRVVLIQGGG